MTSFKHLSGKLTFGGGKTMLTFLCLWHLLLMSSAHVSDIVNIEKTNTSWTPLLFHASSVTFTPPSPCHVTHDVTYLGLYVDCSSQGIASLPLPKQWIPPGTTTLILQSNSLRIITQDSFSTVSTPASLRYLDLSRNEIMAVKSSPFQHFANLQILQLSYNQISLDRKSIEENVFNGLPNLQRLYLHENGNEKVAGQYPDALLHNLTNLTLLFLDTFVGDLNFGSLLNESSKLTSLDLNGGARRITNHSFECLSHTVLKSLCLRLDDLIYTDSGAFSFLTFLDSFFLFRTSQETEVIFESLAPFVNRTMKYLQMSDLNKYYKNSKIFSYNTIITRHKARYLSQICVENFSLTNSKIFIIESGVISSTPMAKCVRNLDISGNPLEGEKIELIRIASLLHLKSIKIADRRYVYKHSQLTKWVPPKCQNKLSALAEKNTQGDYVDGPELHSIKTHKEANVNYSSDYYRLIDSMEKYSSEDHSLRDIASVALLLTQQSKRLRKQIDTTDFNRRSNLGLVGLLNGTQYYFLPKTLETVMANGYSYHLLELRDNIVFVGTKDLRELHVAYNGIRTFTGSIQGLNNLELLDISWNDASHLIPTFFTHAPSLLYLNMANMNLDAKFMAAYSDQLFEPLIALKVLDISQNKLHMLKNGTFYIMPQLSVLIMSNNMFQTLPFRLQEAPSLCFLDLSKNSFRTISESEIIELENHFSEINSFSIKLDGNYFYCGCKNIRFLNWLQETRINLDKRGNYSCISDSGTMTTTRSFEDIEALWRICNGEQSLWMALSLVCLTLLAFICAIVLPKIKTRITAFVARTIWNPMVMKKPADYPIGVFIGYADPDANLACLQIRPYIENRLGMSTYVRHRDLLPASGMAESIIEALHSSWRVLLVVSVEFFQDPWSYFLLKAATHIVSADNPARLVLVLAHASDTADESCLSSRLPPCFLNAVLEEIIIHMTRAGQIDQVEELALKTSLVDSRET